MFKKIILDNGLRILTAPMTGTNTVTILVLCATGSDYEEMHERGLSHFLEHMFFKGTTNRPTSDEIHHELDSMGSISNAFTAHETTGYFIKAGAPYAERSLDILADIYKNSTLPAEEIEKEKQVVIEEIHSDYDDPAVHVWRMWEKTLFGDQPAGRPVAGEEPSVRGYTRDDLLAYFGKQYVARNTAVIVAGNINEIELIAKIREHFSGIRDGEPRVAPSLAVEQSAPLFAAEERKTDQTHCIIGFRGYPVFHERRYAADLLATILGGSWSSRMFTRVRERLGLAYAIYTENSVFSNRGYLLTYTGVSHGNVGMAAEAVLSEYKRMQDELVSEAELERTKQFIKGRTLMALETSNAVASFVGEEEILTRKPLTVDEVFAKLDAVTAADIQSVAQELFRPERLAAVLVGPGNSASAAEAEIRKFA